MQITQYPAPGVSLLRHSGDDLVFELRVMHAGPGRAVLRTQLGGARRRRRELVEAMDEGRQPLALDWNDVPMEEIEGAGGGADGGEVRRFAVRLPLVDIGSFRAKACFFPEGSNRPFWPDGGDVSVKVAPAWTVCWSSIYCAFPRQFGPDAAAERSSPEQSPAASLDASGWTAIPPGGTFRSLARRLDEILLDQRFRIVQLLPVHPVPTTFARMGRFGSPFASTDFLSVDPALAEFDPKATPLDQFRELVDAVHARGGRIFIDLPANHTGWASTLQTHHPEWFRRDGDGSFHSPGAWGVTWEDLVELDHSRPELRDFLASVFEFWCAQGVDGFRCDAGYMVPAETWRYVTARVRESFPDTVFLLEGLGGKISVTRQLIAEEGLDWAYSEIFQTDDRSAFERYLPGALELGESCGPLAHYAETHDNNRLAARSRAWARMRTALAALASQQGCFGITNGVEWFAAEKVDVHGASALRWGSPDNQVAAIRRLNTICAALPAFAAGATVEMAQRGSGNSLALLRRARSGNERDAALVLVNLDPERAQPVHWTGFDIGGAVCVFDSAAADGCTPETARFAGIAPGEPFELSPGRVLCFCSDSAAAGRVEELLSSGRAPFDPGPVRNQELRMAVLRLRRTLTHGAPLAIDEDVDALAALLSRDPLAAVRRFLPKGAMPPVTRCSMPGDAHRVVPLPHGNFLLVGAPHPFRARLSYEVAGRKILKSAISFRLEDGTSAAFVDHPAVRVTRPIPATLRLELSTPGAPTRSDISLLVLPAADAVRAPRSRFTGEEVRRGDLVGLLANGRGAMSRVRAKWGEVRSQYDAILAANPDPEVPCDRHVLFTRCRAWIVNQGFSSELSEACLSTFEARPDAVSWRFDVPVGTGRVLPLAVCLRLTHGENRATLRFERLPASEAVGSAPDDDEPIQLILRPDVESRSFHCKTKAFAGPERDFPSAVHPFKDGFAFSPPGPLPLEIRVPGARFVHEPEWHYMVPNPVEAQRGQDGSDDLFSPGWFDVQLVVGKAAELSASAALADSPAPRNAPGAVASAPRSDLPPLASACAESFRAFVVRREDAPTVIAGYPWFLDWGRDTFIALRGAVAAGMSDLAAAVLRKFAAFEDRGTLPNMIHGADASNRDTSDAPLWFCVVAADLAVASGSRRPDPAIASAVLRICRGYLDGTPNGIRVDPDSALVFSPPHFTWMDTNYPAGTPREGYPVEIQTLWLRALALAAVLEPSGRWSALREKADASFLSLFWDPERGFLSDCLHSPGGFVPAARAVADDHLRCNQLFAVTLGAVPPDHPAARAVVESSERLLVPGAIRTLAPGRVRYELPISGPNGLLNDPARPYWGRYEGDEDTRRKPAYHNGTAWPWPFPSYAEALVAVYGESARQAASSLLSSALPLFERDCAGHLPEIVDGDAPHEGRGCDAQAWSASELLRLSATLGV